MNIVICLVEKNYYFAVLKRKDSNPLYSFPSGKIKEIENIFQAAKRETLEETNISFNTMNSLGTIIKNEVVLHYVHGYYVSGDIKNNEPEKHDSVEWIHIKELSEKLNKTSDIVSDFINKKLNEYTKLEKFFDDKTNVQYALENFVENNDFDENKNIYYELSFILEEKYKKVNFYEDFVELETELMEKTEINEIEIVKYFVSSIINNQKPLSDIIFKNNQNKLSI